MKKPGRMKSGDTHMAELAAMGVNVKRTAMFDYLRQGMPETEPERTNWLAANTKVDLSGANSAEPSRKQSNHSEHRNYRELREKFDSLKSYEAYQAAKIKRLASMGQLHNKSRLTAIADRNHFVVVTILNRLPITCGSRFTDEATKRLVVKIVTEEINACRDIISANMKAVISGRRKTKAKPQRRKATAESASGMGQES